MIPGHPMAGMRDAVAQAASVRAAEEAEEEAMTPYTPASLAGEWEFKIIRSIFKQFGNQDAREHVLADEMRAGWVLVEVFDDARIRLKRQRPASPLKAIEGYDPYRTRIPYQLVPITPEQRALGRMILTGGRVLLAGLLVGAVVATLYATGLLR